MGNILKMVKRLARAAAPGTRTGHDIPEDVVDDTTDASLTEQFLDALDREDRHDARDTALDLPCNFPTTPVKGRSAP